MPNDLLIDDPLAYSLAGHGGINTSPKLLYGFLVLEEKSWKNRHESWKNKYKNNYKLNRKNS